MPQREGSDLSMGAFNSIQLLNLIYKITESESALSRAEEAVSLTSVCHCSSEIPDAAPSQGRNSALSCIH